MKIPIPITATLALAAATVLAGCSTGPAQESGTAPVTASVAMMPVLPDLHALSKEVDTTSAQAALDARVPFAFAIPDSGDPACHSAVIDPNGKVWILNHSGAAPVAGVALDRTLKEYGCTARGGGGYETPGGISAPAPAPASTAPRPEGVPDLSWLSTRVDLTAAGQAMKSGRPFMFGAPDNGVAACHTGLLLRTGDVWVMNVIGAAPATGVALTKKADTYGCRGNGVVLPGQTKEGN